MVRIMTLIFGVVFVSIIAASGVNAGDEGNYVVAAKRPIQRISPNSESKEILPSSCRGKKCGSSIKSAKKNNEERKGTVLCRRRN